MKNDSLYLEKIQSKMAVSLPVISRIIVVSFLIMTIVTFLFRDVETSYYNLEGISLSEFGYQFIIFLIISGILSIFHKQFKKQFLSLLICFLLLVFLVVFSMRAPAISLMIGASIIAIPPMYFSLTTWTKKKQNESKLFLVIAGINLMLFLTVVGFILFNINTEFVLFEGINTSKISNDLILYGNRTSFLKGSIVVSILLLIGYFLINKDSNKVDEKSRIKVLFFGVIGLLFLYQVVMLSLVLVLRVQSLYVATYDFGIFTQMFYNMKHFNGMVTTLERSMVLSHFSVHVSPIYYLILPLFMVFPFPETLEVAQVLIVAIGLIPLYLIAKSFKLSFFITGVMLVMYMYHPAILSSSFYDLHENCFLAPMLLFILYFVIKQKMVGVIISMVLTLMIKEDASIYVFFVGLFVTFGYTSRIQDNKLKHKNVIYGIILMVVSAIYFVGITQIMKSSSEGVMFWRYDNLNAYSELNTIGILITLFQNPSYLFATMFSPDKIYSLLILLFIMGLLPLLSKNLADYWLVVPLIVINFATTYPYQHQFGYQYYYGTTVLLIFMVMLNLRDRISEEVPHQKVGRFSVIYYFASMFIFLFGAMILSTKSYVLDYYTSNRAADLEMREFLVEIPRDKAVLTTSYLTTYLADREALYDFQHFDLDTSDIVFDYIILDKRIQTETLDDFIAEALLHNYQISDLSNEYFVIFIPIS